MCYRPWGRKESDTIGQTNNTQHAFTVGCMKSSNCGKVNCVGVYKRRRPVSAQVSVHTCLFQHACLFV